jgi:CRISPR-associated exonuclease Cas4
MMARRELLQINGIEHFVFCPQQWDLITLEQVWADDASTLTGQLLHKRSDDLFLKRLAKTKSSPVQSRLIPKSWD